MSDINIDAISGDVEFDGVNLSLNSGKDAIAQHLSQRFKTFKGEWFLNLSKGVDWFGKVLMKNPDPIVVDTELKAVIIETPGVTKLLDFLMQIDTQTRELTVSARIDTIDGEINFTEVI